MEWKITGGAKRVTGMGIKINERKNDTMRITYGRSGERNRTARDERKD